MPHQVHLRTLGRTTDHRLSMLRNLAVSVLRYERVRTTEAKAKEVRRFVDRAISFGRAGTLVARRRALALLHDPLIVEKLFDDLAKRYADHASGFTRLVRLGHRVGDGAPMMLVELVEGEAKAERDAAEGAGPAARRISSPEAEKAAEPSAPKGPVARARELARRATGRGGAKRESAPTGEAKEKQEEKPKAARRPRAKASERAARARKRATSGEAEEKPRSARGTKKE